MRNQFCTLPELAKFLRKQPNLSATLEEAKAFGMPDFMPKRAQESGLISVSDDGKTFSLIPEAFSKKFPELCSSRENLEVGLLDRCQRRLIRHDNVSVEYAR